jgi:chromosomal replication initiator protein
MDKKEIWNNCLNSIEEKVGKSVFELWFKPLRLKGIKEDHILLEIPNRFYKEWIEENYADIIKNTIMEITGLQLDTRYSIIEREENRNRRVLLGRGRQVLKDNGASLNPKYTFERFVGGPSNQFARSAALKVAESPGRAYNPLFIYGGVGLGKTHLINAIGNEVLRSKSGFKVLYVQSEQFTNEFVAAIRHDRLSEFKEKYRSVNMLLIDDVQFIATNTHIPEEFFHTFNALYEQQRQIVFSSDRPPREIQDITDRLKSRFTMGLLADIQPPSVELKIAILKEKADEQGIVMPEDVVNWLGVKVKSNVRELEGCLIKLAAHSSLTGVPITLDLAKDVLRDFLEVDDMPITVDKIQKIVAEFFGITQRELKSRKRTKEVALPRQVAMYLSRELTDQSLSDIGKNFGGKDHATVIYAFSKIEKRRNTDEAFNRIIQNILKRIKG